MLDLITANLGGFAEKHGPWEARRDLLVGLLREHQPHVVALQAVGTRDGEDQASELARLAEYPHVERVEGMALLARVPLVVDRPVRLSRGTFDEDPSTRVMQWGRVNGVRIFNCHWSWVYDRALMNFRELLPFVQATQGDRVLVGDLNTTPDREIFEQLRALGWQDAWSTLRPDEPGHTFEAGIRIDYVWTSPTVRPQEITVLPRVSDHSALLCRI